MGNLGLWTAHRLARRGFGRIAVLERGWAGGGATSRSAGVVRQQGGSETAAKLGRLSRELYLRLGEELGLDSGFRETGYYIVAETEEEKDGFLRLVEVRRAAGVENEWVEPEEGRRRFPDLNWDRFVGATYTADDGYVHPPVAARNATYAVLGDEAVDLFEMCEVTGVDQRGDRYSVESTRGVFEAERVVDAGGPRGARDIGGDGRGGGARHGGAAPGRQLPYVPEGVEHPFPLVFNVGKGYYWRPEEQGVVLGMSNPVDEADDSGRYQIDFDWDYYEQDATRLGVRAPGARGLAGIAGVGGVHRLHAGPSADHRRAGGGLLRPGGRGPRDDVGAGAGGEDGRSDLRGRGRRPAEGGRGAGAVLPGEGPEQGGGHHRPALPQEVEEEMEL